MTTDNEKCGRCGKPIGAVIMFDSSTSDKQFCEECHREDMRQMYEKKKAREEGRFQ